jgi:hypothetical protein
MEGHCFNTSHDRLGRGVTRRDIVKAIGGFGIVGLLTTMPRLASASRKSPLTEPGDGSLAELLRLVPGTLAGATPVNYSDYARQRAALGLSGRPAIEQEESEHEAALNGMALSLAGDFSAPEWKSAFGFDRWDVDELLEFPGDEISLTILRGHFDGQTLTRTWQSAGYETAEVEGAPYFSLGEDWAFDFDDPVSNLHFGRFSHLMLLNPSTIIASATRREIEDVTRVQTGRGRSLAHSSTIIPILAALPSNLVTATILDGQWLQPAMDAALIAKNPNLSAAKRDELAGRIEAEHAEALRMPPIARVLAGATAGRQVEQSSTASPAARAIVVAETVCPEAVTTAARIVEERLEAQSPLGTRFAGRPYSELFTRQSVRIVPGQPALVIDLTPAAGTPATIARELLLEQSLTLLSWSSQSVSVGRSAETGPRPL